MSRRNDYDMVGIARRVLRENGFADDLPPHLAETIPARDPVDGLRDMRDLPWSSIDNE